MSNKVEVHIVDQTTQDIVTGVITLVVTLLLLWFFVRANIDTTNGSTCPCMQHMEGLESGSPSKQQEDLKKIVNESKYDDAGYFRELPKGKYEGENVYYYRDEDRFFKPMFYEPFRNIYAENPKMWWRNDYIPKESDFW